CTMVSALNSTVSKICASGLNVTRVPVVSVGSPLGRSPNGTPRANRCVTTCPSRRTSTSSHADKALTTATPTPCNPPDTLYPPSSLNLPPACSTVSTVSTAGRPVCG